MFVCVLSFKTEAENIKRSEQRVQFMLMGTREKAWPGKNGGEEKELNKQTKTITFFAVHGGRRWSRSTSAIGPGLSV